MCWSRNRNNPIWKEDIGDTVECVCSWSGSRVISRVSVHRRAAPGSKLCAVAVGALMVGCILAGCGGAQSTDTTSKAVRIPDEQVLAVPQGASAAVVEARLGEPSSEVTVGSETVFYYGSWRIVLEDAHLARRIRSRNPRQPGSSALSDSESTALDRKILAMSPGISIAKVRETLGTPEQDEEVFEGVDRRVVVLGYGAWQLRFSDGELIERTKF
jgi:hypothetical protein